MTITSSLNASSSTATSSSYESNLLYQSSQTPSNFDSLNSYQNRNQTALQRRALQLRRWREIEELEQKEKGSQVIKPRTATKVCFSPATLFLSACAQRDIDECERLLGLSELQSSGGVNVANCDGLTALHQACIDDNEQMVRWLLSKSAHINCKDNEGWTPLHASASCGNYNIVKILVSHPDCDILALNCDNELACDVCETKECEDLIRSQMNKFLNGDDRGPDFLLLDHEEENENEMFQELRQSELKTIDRDVSEWVTSNGTIDIKAEIERTRDPLSGATILHVCAAKGYNEILHKLLNTFTSQFDLDSFRDCDGYTALHAAAFWKQADTFETLLKFGANPELLTAKTNENIISTSVLELCKNDPKFVQLIEINKEKEKIAKESETQRKIFAKRQREIRRSTQGVKKEDLEKALKIMEISQSSTDSSEKDFNNILTKVNNMDSAVPSSATETDVPPAENESNETSCWTITLPVKSTNSSSNEVDSSPEKSVVLNSGDNSMPETPPTVTMKISSTTPAEYARRRRIKRRATGIEDDSGHVLSPDLIPDPTHPLASNENVDAAFDVILTTPSHQSRSSRLTRPVSNSSSLSSLNSAKSNYDTDDTASVGSLSITSLDGVGSEVQKNQTKSSGVDLLCGSSKSINTSLSAFTSENDLKEATLGTVSCEEIDYKKLCKQLLRENETLRRRIKELEESDKKREQEFSRERRSLQRTISEQEEELKSMNDIKADNMRLKDENAALIRVISKLSK